MSAIKVTDLTFGYDGSYDLIFDQVNFQLDTDWRLGFTGRNGRGKTTFLKLLMGQYAYRGTIATSVSFDYFPYDVPNKNLPTGQILRQICPNAHDWEILRELSLLSLPDDAQERAFATLSNGEQTRALLAALFLNEHRFLLIDEPTNHLDASARQLVAAYLQKKHGFILVSHDRVFLDGCVDHILSINRADIEVRGGNFSAWLRDKEQHDAMELARNEALGQEISRLQQSARRSGGWSDAVEKTKFERTSAGLRPDRGYIGHKAAKMMRRTKATEQRRDKAVAEKQMLLNNVEAREALKLFPQTFHSARLLSLLDVRLFYGAQQVCGPVRLELQQGQRVALCGPNGSGKSSLLKLLCGREIAHTGAVNVPKQLTISYAPQDTGFLRGTVQAYATACGVDQTLFLAILRKLDFERAQFSKDMEHYSDGQKKKVLIARSLCQHAHLYIWDEPLNFIDVFSRMQIESLILAFHPTLLFVEHDAAFCDNIATDRILLDPAGTIH